VRHKNRFLIFGRSSSFWAIMDPRSNRLFFRVIRDVQLVVER